MMGKLSLSNVRPDSECFEKSVRAKCFAEMPLCGPVNDRGQRTELKLCRSECEELYHYCKEEITGKILTAKRVHRSSNIYYVLQL